METLLKYYVIIFAVCFIIVSEALFIVFRKNGTFASEWWQDKIFCMFSSFFINGVILTLIFAIYTNFGSQGIIWTVIGVLGVGLFFYINYLIDKMWL